MLSPYGMEIVESCLTCRLRADRIFCDLPASALQTFENIKYATAYPQGAVLFVEGQMPRGIFVLCKGTVKLSINSPSGRTMIVKLAEPGEVLGLSATVSGKPYEVTAETIDPCQVNFVKRDDFLRFLKDDVEACFKVAEQLSEKYHNACNEVRSLGLSQSAAEKLANLLLEWSSKNGEGAKSEPRLKLRLTHEEIAQMIGTSRETVTRLFADMKRRQIVQSKGSTLVIRSTAALREIANHN
jgi:CRP/FNR family cyclic AMP-dependent transcriptional regulator